MLRFAKLRPCLATLSRFRPQCFQEGRVITSFVKGRCAPTNVDGLSAVHGKGRLFSSTGLFRFATCEDEIHESVGKIENKSGNNQRVQNFSTNAVDQVEQECEDEIFSSIGEFFVRHYFFVFIRVCGFSKLALACKEITNMQ
jgi:hypothetical protein